MHALHAAWKEPDAGCQHMKSSLDNHVAQTGSTCCNAAGLEKLSGLTFEAPSCHR